ncbi:MAG: M23 family metallopeptidase [Elusimicrobia bacterium]|nr:M23 family metallopeptidase [Elusimicrobiota bacterium]
MPIIKSFFRRWRSVLRRTLLYGAAVLSIGAGLRVHSYLSRQAVESDGPYESIVVHASTLGQTRLYDILLETGSSPEEASLISRALSKVAKVRRLLPNDRYHIARSTSGRFHHLTLSSGLTRYVVAGRDGKFRASSRQIPLSTYRHRGAGTLKDNLWLSMEAEGVPPEVIAGFSDVFRWTVDFLTEPRQGDHFAVLWTERRTPGGRVMSRTILSALYDGPETGRRTAVLFGGEYYDADGESLKRMFLRAPLQFRIISSHFSRQRFHPILKRSRHHDGTDYAAPRGTPVVSVANGTVVFAGRDGGYGNVVRVRHDGVYSTRYAHLSRFAKPVRKGSSVKQGQAIGFVGSTGLATGPHLHFEIEKNGRPENFLKLDLPFARSLAGNRLREFRRLRDRRQAEIDPLLASVGSGPSR